MDTPGPAYKAFADALRRAVKEKRVEVTIAGLGAVRIDYIGRTRFVNVNGRISTLRQVTEDAMAVDSGQPTLADKCAAMLAQVQS